MHDEQQPIRSQSDAGQSGLSVAQAAATLGLSVNAVRHRIRRGSLAASKLDGEWRVFVDVPADTRHGQWPRTMPDRPTDTGAAQLAILRDTLLAPLIALTERQQTFIAEQAQRLGRAESEREVLRSRVRALEAEQTEWRVSEPEAAPEAARRAWWQFWRP